MAKTIGFALGGGGARGALQVGALRALFEHGIKPEVITGTSIGAMNAVSLGLFGTDLASIDKLEEVWNQSADLEIMDPRFQNLIVRALIGRPDNSAKQKTIDFLTHFGIQAEMTFTDFSPLSIGLVSTDLTGRNPIVYGVDPQDNVLEGVLASIAIQPWFMPLEVEDKFLIDGGFVSNVPIQVAMEMGANEIFALDLNDPTPIETSNALNKYIDAVTRTVCGRITNLEIDIAKLKGVRVHHITLTSAGMPTWDFSNTTALIGWGYAQMHRKLTEWVAENPELASKLNTK
jgi:NTE family protein